MKQIFSILLFMCVFIVSDTYADNARQRVINELNNIDNNWQASQFKSWINSGDKEVLRVGDKVVFHFSSQEKSYLTILHVDAYGVVSVSFPLMSERGEGILEAGKIRLLPGRGDDFTIEAEPPIGRDSIYILATKQPVDREALGLSIDETSIPVEEAKLFLNDLNSSLSGNRVAVAKIEQNIIGRSGNVGYNENDVVAVFEKKPLMRSFSRRKTSSSQSSRPQSIPKQQQMVKAKLNLYINFESGSDQLTDVAKENLDQVGLAFQRQSLSHKKFVLSGHTDDVGEDEFNLALSERRANTAKDYLMNKYQINATRLSTLGYGESKPIEAGNNQFARAANRRVEIEEWHAGMDKPMPKDESAAEKEDSERDGTIEWLDQ